MSTTEPDLEVKRINYTTERVIGCAIEVHRSLGPGLLERIYEEAMCLEMDKRRVKFVRQASYPVQYKGTLIGEHRIDLVVEDAIVVELKSVEKLDAVYTAQVLTYLKCTGLRVGLLINFNGRLLRTGIRRFIV